MRQRRTESAPCSTPGGWPKPDTSWCCVPCCPCILPAPGGNVTVASKRVLGRAFGPWNSCGRRSYDRAKEGSSPDPDIACVLDTVPFRRYKIGKSSRLIEFFTIGGREWARNRGRLTNTPPAMTDALTLFEFWPSGHVPKLPAFDHRGLAEAPHRVLACDRFKALPRPTPICL